MLDRYELVCPLAEGGMAEIWIARLRGKHGLDTLFAVKVLSQRLADEPEARKMLLDEARIAARIRHPHVASIIELGEVEGTPYLVLEWVLGESLSVLRRAVAETGRPFPARMALTLLAHASAGLHAAHELTDDDGTRLGVVHRDVSPQNILVGAAGDVKVIDFGIAKAKRRLVETTRHGDIKGKLQYMAPEQLGKDEVDRRADVWAIGAVLHQLLTGRAPFSGHDELSTMRMLLARERPARIEGLSPELARILDSTLAPDPDERFHTAEELSHALEQAAHVEGGMATPREVGRFCEGLVGPRLAQRRAAVQNSRPGLEVVQETRTAPTERVIAEDATGASSAQTLPAAFRTREAVGRRRRIVGAGVAALIVAAGVATWILRALTDPPGDSGVSAATAPLPIPELTLAPAITALPEPTASATAELAPSARAAAPAAKGRRKPALQRAPAPASKPDDDFVGKIKTPD
jgi:eukaryotic-like serine/threonine-protein kinase